MLRDGDAVVARTHLGRPARVVVAGHIDTVPIADNLPTRLVGEGAQAELWGRGTVDMKGGVAVQLALAAELSEPTRDVTWVFYDHEEVAADAQRARPDRARRTRTGCAGDFAVLGEPTNGGIEGGCNGTLRVEVRLTGVAAHSARAWMGVNAIHAAGEVLRRLEAYDARARSRSTGWSTGRASTRSSSPGGIAGNVIPDACVVTVNYRFAPSASVEQASAHVRELFDGLRRRDRRRRPRCAPGPRRPGRAGVRRGRAGGHGRRARGQVRLDRRRPVLRARGARGELRPGDPLLAHKRRRARASSARSPWCTRALRDWLTA